MYGIVNKVISNYIVSNYGSETWQTVQQRAGVDTPDFVLDEFYDDETTFSLLESAAETLGLSMRDLNLILGKHWVLGSDLVNARFYMCSGADNLKTFLQLLPTLHARVMLHYPKAKAPEFQCTVLDKKRVRLDYFSDRTGFDDYLEGLLWGLAEFYDETVSIKLLQPSLFDESTARNHSAFEVQWSS